MKYEIIEFKNAYKDWSRLQRHLNREMDSIANFPCDEEEDLEGLYWKRIKQSDEQYCIFLKDGEKIVGMIVYIGYKKYIDVKDFYIEKEYRNKGYGKEMLKQVQDIKNGRVMYIGTVGGNERALKLYQEFGFKILDYSLQMN